jgi:hypothetical protein
MATRIPTVVPYHHFPVYTGVLGDGTPEQVHLSLCICSAWQMLIEYLLLLQGLHMQLLGWLVLLWQGCSDGSCLDFKQMLQFLQNEIDMLELLFQ